MCQGGGKSSSEILKIEEKKRREKEKKREGKDLQKASVEKAKAIRFSHAQKCDTYACTLCQLSVTDWFYRRPKVPLPSVSSGRRVTYTRRFELDPGVKQGRSQCTQRKEGKSRVGRKKRRRKKKEKGAHAAGSLVFLVLRLQFPHDRRCRETTQSVQSLVQLQTQKGDSFSTHRRQFSTQR